MSDKEWNDVQQLLDDVENSMRYFSLKVSRTILKRRQLASLGLADPSLNKAQAAYQLAYTALSEMKEKIVSDMLDACQDEALPFD